MSITGVTIACTLLASFILPLAFGQQEWYLSQDTWSTVGSARWIWNGGAGTVYQANPWWSALPGFPALLAPIVGIGDHLGLVDGAPFPLSRPTMWLLVGPFFAAVGSTAVVGLAHLLRSLGVSTRSACALLLGTGLVVVAPTVLFGHPEDLAALGAALWAVGDLRLGRPGRAATLLAAGILLQTWVGLLLPLLVVAQPAGARLRFALWASALPGGVGLLLLGLDWRHASADVLGQPMADRGQHLIWWAFAAHRAVTEGSVRIPVVVGSSTRTLAVVIAVAVPVGCRRRIDVDTLVPFAALVLLSRVVFETELWPYYAAPAALLLMVSGVRARRRVALGLAAVALYAGPALAYAGIDLAPGWWSAGYLVAAGIGAVLAWRRVASRADLTSHTGASATANDEMVSFPQLMRPIPEW